LNYTRAHRSTPPMGMGSRSACPDIVQEGVGCSRAPI